MSHEMHVPTEVTAGIDDETRHLIAVDDLHLPPGAEATAAFVSWARQNPFWHHHSEMARRVDYHAEGADWVYECMAIGQQALAGVDVSIGAA